MAFISNEEWAEYEKTINDFHDDAFQQELKWIRNILPVNIHGEDTESRYLPPVTLRCLIQFNHFRSWPINKESEAGQIDSESMLVFINIAYLKNLGYTDANDNWLYDPGLDRFEVDGVVYVDKGNSKTAQAKDKALLHFMVLKREELNTPG